MQIAYVARYGKQQLSEIRAMTPADLNNLIKALSAIVAEENPKK